MAGSGYGSFAFTYDRLTSNISYPKRAAYFHALMERYRTLPQELLLDLACGTGSLSVEFAKLGYEVIGVDGSNEMLAVAMEKNYEQQTGILFLCQDMTQLDLYGTVDVTVCALDSLNHLTDPKAVQRTLDRVSLFTAPGGLFLFDVNTPYKHQHVLGNQIYLYDFDDLFCAWQNSYEEKDRTVTISLNIFEEKENGYTRYSECFQERAYSQEELEQFLIRAGFEIEAVYGEDTLEPPAPEAERWIYVTRKQEAKGAGSRKR